MRPRQCALCAAGVAALLLNSPSAAAAARSYTIVIDKLKFGSVPSVLHPGDTIIWVNHDFLRHSATAVNRSFDVDLQPGAKAATVVRTKGSIVFVCRYHPGMRGLLVVK